MVAFFVFSQSLSTSGPWPWSPVLIAAIANLFGPGASMALHSMLGFGAGFIAPLAFGAALDATGPGAWMFAYASLGLLGVFAPLILKLR